MVFVVLCNGDGEEVLSIGETVDGHDVDIMGIRGARGLDDAMWIRWNADMMCSPGQRQAEGGMLESV
jgi:hypothetical protein